MIYGLRNRGSFQQLPPFAKMGVIIEYDSSERFINQLETTTNFPPMRILC